MAHQAAQPQVKPNDTSYIDVWGWWFSQGPHRDVLRTMARMDDDQVLKLRQQAQRIIDQDNATTLFQATSNANR